MSVSSEITNAASATAQYQAAQPKATGVASKLGSQEFMNLMMKQLQYQDPMEPVSNTEFIAQQAQFSQLSTTQDMSASIASNNSISQAMSLVGKTVTLTNPDDSSKTITGEVTSSSIKGKNSTIQVNGKDYPLSYLKTVNSTPAASTSSPTSNTAATSTPSWDQELLQGIKTLPAQIANELKTAISNFNASSASNTGSSGT